MQVNSPSIYGCTEAPEGFKTPQNSLLTYNPRARRLYIHLLDWPMGQLTLDGYADRVKYAQFLHDASEVEMSSKKDATWMPEDAKSGDLILRLPVVKPNVEIPVIELFLK
jgi:alpha-L-fucosidase